MSAPELWLNGRKITGRAKDRAPVLAPVELQWGAGSAMDQPDAANLNFTVLFRDGMHDMPDLVNGAKVEMMHPNSRRTIFAGTIRTMSSSPSDKLKGGLEVTINATDYTADLEGEYLATDWTQGLSRRRDLIDAFKEAGWELELPVTEMRSAKAVYNSIKLATMLDRHTSRYRGRRYDASYRNSRGIVVRRATVFEGSSRFIPADTLIAGSDKSWSRTYNSPTIGGQPSPLLLLPASNALLNPKWSQDPANTITGVQMSLMTQGDDGFTTQMERNFKAAPNIVAKYGLRTTEIESDLAEPADWPTAANAWMNDDSPWQMSELEVRDSTLLDAEDLLSLLDHSTRYMMLVTVTGILANRPDPGPTVMRSYLLGGTYTWTGTKWEISLALERTIYARPIQAARYIDIADATDPNISTATLADIGQNLSFADFRELEAPN